MEKIIVKFYNQLPKDLQTIARKRITAEKFKISKIVLEKILKENDDER